MSTLLRHVSYTWFATKQNYEISKSIYNLLNKILRKLTNIIVYRIQSYRLRRPTRVSFILITKLFVVYWKTSVAISDTATCKNKSIDFTWKKNNKIGMYLFNITTSTVAFVSL